MSKGIAYGVGVGPGDPELMTLRACSLIRENEKIYRSLGEIPDDAGYFSLIVAKEKKEAGK